MLDEIDQKIKEIGINIYKNICYGIKCSDPIKKEELKKLLPKNNTDYPSTNIEISIDDNVSNSVDDNVCNSVDDNVSNNPFKLFNISIKNCSIFLYGEYRKLSRNITQTPLFYKKELKSVSDFTNQLISIFDCKKINFIGLGREDLDVQMIGYRPFVLEIIDPKKGLSFEDLSLNIYKEIDIRNLKTVKPEIKKYFQDTQQQKLYKVKIACDNIQPLEIKTYTLLQKTPLRVLHRRANLIRERKIEIIEFDCKDCLVLKAESGTYIKEFINGDFGRTMPNLSSMFNSEAECLELDVLEILDFKLPDNLILKELHLVTLRS